MFDHLIIDYIKRKEKERKEYSERPFLELPLEPPPEFIEETEEEEPKRVIVIDLNDP